ncbi:helix-turn-helix domain-containing protein [Negativibacillus massiliensis]|uniref:helix-turn-helix domain-containing protein n=1 Tax=Negativibacillus massiliensis TaxID=1871035 RepID=UPI003AF3010A
MSLVNKIKKLCDEKGMTFASLERELKFGNGTIRKWDNATPSGDKLAKVADFFNVSVDYLLDREANVVSLDKKTRSIRSLARLQENTFTEAEDAQIDDFISFLLSKRDKNKDI